MKTTTGTLLLACTVVASPASAQDKGLVKEVERLAASAVALATLHIEDLLAEQQTPRTRDSRPRSAGNEQTEQFSRTVRIGRSGLLDLSNVSGDIVINGVGGDDARIAAAKRVRHQDDNTARALLRDMQIQVMERGNGVEVRTEMPQQRGGARRGYSASVDYTVAVPNGSSVTVRTVSGDVRISNVRGEVRAEATSGDVHVSNVGRLNAVRVVSGDLHLSDSEVDDLRAETTSGDVVVRNLKGRLMEINSISGDLRLTGAEVERIYLGTTSGDIDFEGALARNGRYEFKTHSGDVRVTAPSNSGFDLEASTFGGDLRSDFTLQLSGSRETFTGRFNGENRGIPFRNREVRATANNGGAQLMLRTFNGDVVLIRR